MQLCTPKVRGMHSPITALLGAIQVKHSLLTIALPLTALSDHTGQLSSCSLHVRKLC